MTRKIIIVVLRIVSVLLILWGVFHLIAIALFVSHQMDFDHPVALCVLSLAYGCACILLGILSGKRADCFRSSSSALVLLVGRIITFFIAYIFIFGVAAQIEEPRAHATLEMRLTGGITEGVLVLLFLGGTFALTLVNKERSCEAQNLPSQHINTERQ